MLKKGYTRRQILKGAAGASLAIPFLPSISTAQSSGGAPKRLVCLWWPHGGVHSEMDDGAFFPRSETLNWQTRSMVGSETYKVADLNTGLSINEKMTDILDGGFNPYMSKVNFYQGLDICQKLDHHSYPFGSIGPKYKDPDPFDPREAPRTGTVDQEIARYPGFYPANFGGQRSVHISPFDRRFGVISSCYVGVNNEIIGMGTSGDPGKIFEQLFGKAISTDDSQGLKSIVDAVLGDYQRVRKLSGISVVDRSRLDAHIEGLADINRRFQQRAKECSDAIKPPSLDGYDPRNNVNDGVERAGFFNDMIASAFLCDTTRIASLSVGWGNAIPDWPLNDEHGTLWHPCLESEPQSAVRRSVWYFLRAII